MAGQAMTSSDWRTTIDPSKVALFLDVDGTLLGFKDRPEDVVADEALRDTLVRLRAKTGGALALVSGRTLSDLDRIMAPLVFTAGATHGADMRWPDGRSEAMGAEALAQVRPVVEAFVAARKGLRLEDKGAALAVHFRQVPAREDEVGQYLDTAVAGHDLMIQRGKMVAEVKSSLSSKGKAIEQLMGIDPFAGRVAMFIGDDLTDEHGFASINALDGISIKVGSPHEKTIARFRLDDVPAVRVLLHEMSLER